MTEGADLQPTVSICCPVYNHAQNLPRMLDSLLAQQGERFEILLNDDASTDGSTEILRDYESRYPGVVRVVYHDENQYSKMPIIAPRFLFPIARGEFVAFCEGDDFWLSPDKLSRQVAAMRRHPEVGLSFHPVQRVRGESDNAGVSGQLSSDECRVPFERVVLGGGGFCPTPSVMLRAEYLPAISRCVEIAPVSDKFFQIIATSAGGALFIPDVLSAYRVGNAGAWTQRFAGSEMLQQYESLVEPPYRWLLNNLPESQHDILRFSLADQFMVLAMKYFSAGVSDRAANCYDKAMRELSSRRFPLSIMPGGDTSPAILKLVSRGWPLLRTAYRKQAMRNSLPEG